MMRVCVLTILVTASVLVVGVVREVKLRAKCRHAASLLTTSRRKTHQVLAEARRVSHARDLSLAVLAHELRRPLTPMLAMVSLLEEDEQLSPDTRDTLASIHRNCEVAARLVEDLRDLARIDHGKFSLRCQPVALETVIAVTVQVCRPDVAALNISLAVETGGGPYLLLGDAQRLQQVFWNLIKNAAKFTPPGGRICLTCRRAPDKQIIVDVADDGEGIDPAALKAIFQPFEQVGAGRQFGGLGLGLAISKAIVEMHGGAITAHSQGKGKGATFSVRLPPHPSC